MTKIGQFFRESKAELKKVVWPSRADVVSSVKVVIISSIILAVILGALDLGFTKGFEALLKA
ncbi:MAG: preprotein translocase subunit SecE [Treponema sp.]|nr:preprotein translocase subunit SecE [Treponema sp.]